MRPYYEHAGITIYHGDCREILPSLQKDSVDLLVTDPPYGVNFQSSWRQETFAPIMGDESSEMGLQGISAALPVLTYQRHLYIFGRFDLSSLPVSTPVELVWDKQYLGMGDLELPWGIQHEYIQFCVSLKRNRNREANGRLSLAARLRRGSILSFPRRDGNVTDHPTEKPVALLRELIESSSRIGESVLDCFCGSGSTVAAAKAEGRKAIGIEIEEKYCEIAAKRLSQEVFNFEVSA
jgi:DNA modification methylase